MIKNVRTVITTIALSLLLSLIFWTCKSSNESSNLQEKVSIESSDAVELILIGTWKHSKEEDSEGVKVYRKSDYNFPPSRGRVSIEFKVDHSLIYSPIGANDFHEGHQGKWSLNETTLTLEYNNVSKTYSVLELNKNIIKLK